ncbi:hypothetical protein ABI015_14935, partial [Enterococcus faecium]
MEDRALGLGRAVHGAVELLRCSLGGVALLGRLSACGIELLTDPSFGLKALPDLFGLRRAGGRGG